MTQSNSSSLAPYRPANLLSKIKIEHRDDIHYPFYDSFPAILKRRQQRLKDHC